MDPSGSTIDRGQGLSLIGYRASGKSTIARLIARALDRPCIDVDHEIERRTRMSVPEIFVAEGEASFRDHEERALRELCHEFPNAVLATGGGAILRAVNRVTLHRFGPAIWLKAPSGVLVERLRRDPSARPSLTAAGLLDEVQEVLKMREPLYESVADLVVDATPDDPSIVAESILRRIALFRVQR